MGHGHKTRPGFLSFMHSTGDNYNSYYKNEIGDEKRFKPEESPPVKQKTKYVINCLRKQAKPCTLYAMQHQLISYISTTVSPKVTKGELAVNNKYHI